MCLFDLKHPKQLNQSWTRFSEILILSVFEGWTVWGGGGVGSCECLSDGEQSESHEWNAGSLGPRQTV